MTTALSVRACRRPWAGIPVRKTLNLMTLGAKLAALHCVRAFIFLTWVSAAYQLEKSLSIVYA